MKLGVYFCNCGSNIADKIDSQEVEAKLTGLAPEIRFKTVDFLCSEDGRETLQKDIAENKVERVVIAACTPRDHEATFMRTISAAGLNPYLMQMVNAREHVAWVTEDRTKATEKAIRYIRAAIRRVERQVPLTKREITACPDVLVIGAGPAGLKAALALAESGRRVVLVEKSPFIGGMPVRIEELFPNGECGSCMLEPLMADVLHGPHAGRIELLTMAEVTGIAGFYGNFTVSISRKPRYIGPSCIGCAECVEACPVSVKNEFNDNRNDRKAVFFPFPGALPNIPLIDGRTCLKLKGEACEQCRKACPVDDAIIFNDTESVTERAVGAIVVAIGAGLYDCARIPNLSYGVLPDIYTAHGFEIMTASNGPCAGEILTSRGDAPRSVAIIHCVGSLDPDHREYCSGICCQYAFKFNHFIGKKLPGVKIYHFYRELSIPGKGNFNLCQQARSNTNSVFIRYRDIRDLSVLEQQDRKQLIYKDAGGKAGAEPVDMVILCPAVVPGQDSGKLAAVLETNLDRFGFFEELHATTDSVESKIKGIFFAGACQSPMDIEKAMGQGMAAAGCILSRLIAGTKLEIQPIAAVVDAEKCSGCKICLSVCPFKAISYDAEKNTAAVNDVLCRGCGACAAACPANSIRANHFTDEELLTEIDEVLK